MKEKFKWILVLVLVVGGVWLYKHNQKKASFYYFCDNENGYYDIIYDKIDTPPYASTLSPSQEKLDLLQTIENVKAIYPFIPISSRLEGEDWEKIPLEIIVIEDGKSRTVQLPQRITINEEETITVPSVYFKSYVDESMVTHQMSAYGDNILSKGDYRVFKLYSNGNSGIYMGEFLYNALGISDSVSSLQLTIPCYVPITSKIELARHTNPVDEYGIPYGDDEFDFYAESQTISRYQQVLLTFDIQGVLDNEVNNLYIPAWAVEEMYEQIDLSQVVLEENEILYEPISYFIELEKKESIQSLGNKIDDVMDRFALGNYWVDELVSYSE